MLFKCPSTGEDFDSGFRAGLSEMKLLPVGAKFKIRCEVCGELHEFKFADATVKDEGAARQR